MVEETLIYLNQKEETSILNLQVIHNGLVGNYEFDGGELRMEPYKPNVDARAGGLNKQLSIVDGHV